MLLYPYKKLELLLYPDQKQELLLQQQQLELLLYPDQKQAIVKKVKQKNSQLVNLTLQISFENYGEQKQKK